MRGSLQAGLLQQTAQPRQSSHHLGGRAGAGASHRRSCCATRRAGTYDFRLRLSYSRLSLSRLVVAMFLGSDQQRRRHHPRSTGSSARAQSQCPPELLHSRQGRHSGGIRASSSAFSLLWWAMFFFRCAACSGLSFWPMFLTTMSGVAIGLVISALVNESKTAVLAIPVVLIPQIILAGALIKYEDMNRDLDFVYSVRQWAARHPGSAMEPRSDLKVPFICSLMPMRWSYEALVFAQSKLNPLTRRAGEHPAQIDELAGCPILRPTRRSGWRISRICWRFCPVCRRKSSAALDREVCRHRCRDQRRTIRP